MQLCFCILCPHDFLSLHSQQFVNIPCLFLVIDSMNWFYFRIGGGWGGRGGVVVWLAVSFSVGTMNVCHSSFIIEIGVYLLQA